MAASTLVAIPARWGSTRLPGKPLRPIAGRTLLARTIALARSAIAGRIDTQLVVATDDPRIVRHAQTLGVHAVMTDPSIATGSGRALAAADALGIRIDHIVNLQGDAPFQPPHALGAVLDALDDGAEVATPVVALPWAALDALRSHKRTTPFSGTTCARAASGQALWFSKTILPAIRDEAKLRAHEPSPVWRHIGLYGYRRAALARFEATPPTELEMLEGLEQLRLIELGIPVRAVPVLPGALDLSGIDTEADIALAERLIAQHGDPTPP